MQIQKYIYAVILSCLMAIPLSARERTFYDSKSNIVCITGDYELLAYGNKYRKVEVTLPREFSTYTAKQLTEALNNGDYGKMILDYLFCYNGTSLSEDRLKELAMQNVLKSDDERASIGVISKENILKEDYLPILENNYIFIITHSVTGKKIKYKWNVFKVEINQEILDQVFNSWNDMGKYNQIKVPVSFVSSDKAAVNKDIQSGITSLKKKTKRKISFKVPAFAIRGQVIGRSPFLANIGSAYGLHECDKVAIYRTKEKKGKMYSSKVSTTRASDVSDSTVVLYTFAGGRASYKKGDVAVYKPSSNTSISVTGEYMDHSYGLSIGGDYRLSLSRFGMSQYIILKLGAGVYENFDKRIYLTDIGNIVRSPYYMNAGLGYGLGFEFAHCLEIEPYLMAQWERLNFTRKSGSGTDNIYHDSYDNEEKEIWTKAVRLPVGVKLNLNIFYPLQLTVGGEYIFNFDVDKVKDDDNTKSHPERFFFGPTGYKRSGLNLYAGFRLNF